MTIETDELNRPTRKLNRYNRIRYKAGLYWCGKCDRNIVAEGQKCSVCGAVDGKRRLKKQDVIE